MCYGKNNRTRLTESDCQTRHGLGRYLVVVLISIFPSSLYAISESDLADICEAMEQAIVDIAVDYEWDTGPTPPIEERRDTSDTFTVGPKKIFWAIKRPFGERALFNQSFTTVDRFNVKAEQQMMLGYDGKVAKHLTRAKATGSDRFVGLGTISASKRFNPHLSETPAAFSVLRCGMDREGIPIYERLRKAGFARLTEGVEIINGFTSVGVDFLRNVPDFPGNHKQPYLRVYFAVDHAYTPVRYQFLEPSANGPKESILLDVQSLERCADGVWFPSKGTISMAQRGTVGTYSASKITLNQGLTDDDFTIEFPPELKVMDKIAGVTYVVKP